MESIADRINELILELEITKNAFAMKIGISSSLISQITTKKNNFRADILQKITSAYPDISAEWLLNGVGKMWIYENSIFVENLRNPQKAPIKIDTSITAKHSEIKPSQELPLSRNLTPRQWLILQKNREKAQKYFENIEGNLKGLLNSLEEFIYFPHMANIIIDQYFSKLSDIIYIDSEYLKGENFDYSMYIAKIENELNELQIFKPALLQFEKSIASFYKEFGELDTKKVLDNMV